MSMIKRKIYFNYEKEEKWINEMAQQGWHLIDYSIGKYTFEEDDPGKYIYRSQQMGNQSEEEVEAYFQMMEEGGVELIAYKFGWAIFRKRAEEGPFEIFSDIPSKVKHYQSISKMLGFIALLNLGLGIMNLNVGNQVNKYVSIISFLAVLILLTVIAIYLTRAKKLSDQDDLLS